jgi:hypothetical protein
MNARDEIYDALLDKFSPEYAKSLLDKFVLQVESSKNIEIIGSFITEPEDLKVRETDLTDYQIAFYKL